MASFIQGEKDGQTVFLFEGDLNCTTVSTLYPEVNRALDVEKGPVLLDLKGIDRMDSAGAAFIGDLAKKRAEKNLVLEVTGLSERLQHTLNLFRYPAPAEDEGPKKKAPFFSRVADVAIDQWKGFHVFLMLTADCFIWTFKGAERTKRVRKGAVWTEGNRIGVESLGIVGLISFLVGMVLSLQSASQLQQFGADIYVANLVAVSMTREMGPLMTAIIIAGRSGAAIAAEIATMSVNEEIEALQVMGLEETRYVVVPKFQAITLSMPALTMYADVLGILGGAIVGMLYMKLSMLTFFTQVAKALVLKDILTGLLKSVAFAWVIVLIASHNGFQAYGGAESVGRSTTQSVVKSIFWVIIIDAIFNIVFYF